jgi:hypothetical protein
MADGLASAVNHLSRFLFSKDLDAQICEQMDIYRSLVLGELQKHGTRQQPVSKVAKGKDFELNFPGL